MAKAAKKTTKYGIFEGQLYYPRLFESKIDDAEYHEKTQGQYNVTFVPKDNDELNKMLELGFPEVAMDHPQLREVAAAGGRIGMKLKRPNVHPSVAAFGGAPKVTHGKTTDVWDEEVDGELGNGTEAFVKISIYGSGSRATVRLESVGITELVEYKEGADQPVW